MGASLSGVCQQMEAAGLPSIRPDQLKLDTGRWVRYGKGKKAYYKLYSYQSRSGEQMVSYGTFGMGGDEPISVAPESHLRERLSSEEWLAMQAKRLERQRAEERKAAELAHLAANRAKDQWAKASESGSSGYLVRKQVARAEGVRYMVGGDFDGWIIMLLYHYGRNEVVGSQKIAPAPIEDGGDKRFNKGMAMEGAALRLGDAPVDGDLIMIGEGYATCASAREGCGYAHPVYVACHAGNLLAVATILRGLYPSSPFLFLADDDYLPKRNGDPNHIGAEKAAAAAAAVGNSRVLLPQFAVPRRASRDDTVLPHLTDFNDLHAAEGTEAVSVQIRAGIAGTVQLPAVAGGVAVESPPAPSVAVPAGDAGLVPAVAGMDGVPAEPAASDPPWVDDAEVGVLLSGRELAGGHDLDADPDGAALASPHPPLEAPTGVQQPGGAGEVVELWSARLLKHFALIAGKNKFWSDLTKLEMGRPALNALVGDKKVVDAWLAHEARRTISPADVARQKEAGEQKAMDSHPVFSDSLGRYVYLDGSDSIWDNKLRKTITNSALKLALGDWYKTWLNDPRRRVLPLEHLVFDPTQQVDAETHINLFRGLPLKPAFPPGVTQYDDPFAALDHFDQCEGIIELLMWLCNHRLDVLSWLLCWLAYPLQHVGAKMDTAVLMHGDIHGTGKSLFFECVIKPLYGEYAVTLSQHQLESQYTSWRSQRLFCLFEEVLASNQKYSHTGTLKQMVTGKTHMIEKKFVDAWEEANHMNSVFLSNAVQPFHIEQSDRRFLVIWPGAKATEAMEAKVKHELANGGVKAFYAFLLAHPLVTAKTDQEGNVVRDEANRPVLAPFTPHSKPLMTPEKLRVIHYGLAGWELFVMEWKAGMVGGLGEHERIPYCSCLSNELYQVYKRWCSAAGERELSRNKFSNLLSARVPKSVRYYMLPGTTERYQHHIFRVGTKPEGLTEEAWLGRDIADFRAKADRWGLKLTEVT